MSLGHSLNLFESSEIASTSEFSTQIRNPPVGFSLPASLSGLKVVISNETYSTNIKPEDLISTISWTNTYYVDGVGGSDANSGLTWALRKKSIGNTMRAASTSGLPSRILVWAKSGLPYYRQVSASDDGLVRASAVPILLEAMNGRVQIGPYDNLTWSKTGGLTYTYQATRSSAIRVLNPLVKTDDGLYTDYVWVASSAAVDALEGSWYSDGTTVFVHPHNHDEPSLANARVLMSGVRQLEWQSNQNLFVRGFDFEGGPQGTKIFGGSTNTVVFDDCTFRYATSSNTFNGGVTTIDGLQVLGCGLLAAFNSKADKNSKDGFNIHSEGAVIPAALLVNCSGTLNGLNPSVSNNGFTTHDGVKAVSVGCNWAGNYGTGSGHVSNDTQVWSVGDVSGDSMGDVIYGGSLDRGGFAVWSGSASMWLDNCMDRGSAIGVFADVGSNMFIRNHRGTGVRTNAVSY